MEKKTLIRFLKEKRRGSYTLVVAMYADLFTSMSISMAMTVIEEDLERESGAKLKLHYFSLARAISRFKRKAGIKPGAEPKLKREFKDAHEIKEGQSATPGTFKVGAKKAKQGQDVQ